MPCQVGPYDLGAGRKLPVIAMPSLLQGDSNPEPQDKVTHPVRAGHAVSKKH